jgi:hypothetical protein
MASSIFAGNSQSITNILPGKNMDSYINHYIGEWENEAGNCLKIKKVDDGTALVSFFSPPDHQPVLRPWYDQNPTIDMIAKYRPAESPELVVELWDEGKGFELHLTFEFGYMSDIQHRDSLVPGISRFQEDDFLDEYYHYFEPLKHYLKTSAEPPA